LVRLHLLSPPATLLLLLICGPAGTTLTAFLRRDITWLDQALAALWFVASGPSIIAWRLVVAFSLLPIRSRLLPEFLLFSALLFLLLFHGTAGSSSALAALLGIACGFVVVSTLVYRWPVCRWAFYRLLLLQGPALAALAMLLLGILRGPVVVSALVCRWPVCRWTFCRLFLAEFAALAALLLL
jgi:hypothetical protein